MSIRERFRSHGRVNVLGVGVDAVSIAPVAEIVVEWILALEMPLRPRYVCVTGVHGVMESRKVPGLRQILNEADLNVPDGMPLVWLGHFAGFVQMDRVFGPDLMLEVCRRSSELGLRHYFYGGRQGVAEKLAKTLKEKYPGLSVAGVFCPPFRPLSEREKDEVAGAINEARPDIVWIGLSTPKQEMWMAEFVPRVRTKVLLGVGAAFDYNTGGIRRAPRWVQRSGFEWAFRLIQEPRRLARRYLVNNPEFVFLTILQAAGIMRAKPTGEERTDNGE